MNKPRIKCYNWSNASWFVYKGAVYRNEAPFPSKTWQELLAFGEVPFVLY